MSLFVKGIDSKLTLIIGGDIIDELTVKNFTAQPDITAIKDDCCGEDRTRLDAIVNFYGCSLETYTQNKRLLDKLITYHDHRNRGIDDGAEIGFRIAVHDGTAPGLYSFGGLIVFGGWNYGFSGRAERNMIKLPFDAQYMKAL